MLLAEKKQAEATVTKDPALAAAEAILLDQEKKVETARRAFAFAKIGQTGTIIDDTTRRKTEVSH